MNDLNQSTVLGRRALLCSGVAVLCGAGAVSAQTPTKSPRIARYISGDRALREMQVHQIKEMGLEIWIENQPPWTTGVQKQNGRYLFTAQSPDRYHPPSAMTFSGWSNKAVSEGALPGVARSAIVHGAQNFGVSAGEARALAVFPASHGILQGSQARFSGQAQDLLMDVQIFVGQAPGKFPVALTVYTLKDKMVHLEEVIRRSWSNVQYLT
ncbi:hypothetical protein [Hydrogenophaga sp. PAMC20947]|uniref:hypothetical protein n=1 Tax=Hydrogenophaga sp. PAMC20947 TaxID=2565558 RepID=UPI00109D934B|nr:hypothetical protein [Hydrogenophaga sp. PAMC20947]QCB47232.1 hypothetical protein E5678_15080 [Hydrogenophaga sp. PAMC20947]